MSTTEYPAATEPDSGNGACAVCPHPWHTHDPIGVRYCSAMAASGVVRGCVCVGSARSEDQTRKHYVR